MAKSRKNNSNFFLLFLVIAIGVIGLWGWKNGSTTSYNLFGEEKKKEEKKEKEKPFVATHQKTPDAVKAIYMSSWIAGVSSRRDALMAFINQTELNSVVIDIKDDTGKISFTVHSPELSAYHSSENRIPDIRELIQRLHENNIYVIGRISVFQDPYLTSQRPDLAIKSKKTGEVWKDRKGLSFLDVGQKEVAEYVALIAKEAYANGFDEINFDYIRYPSDGNVADINYPVAEGKTRADMLEDFFASLYDQLEKTDIVTSADLFGMTTTNHDDLNIGQVLERAAPYFDFICPMVYPSHYPTGFHNLGNPNEHPYEVIHYSMSTAVERLMVAGQPHTKLRPWIQDFDYGGIYDVAEVEAQKKAVYDSGLTSWMAWDPNNRYTRGAYETE